MRHKFVTRTRILLAVLAFLLTFCLRWPGESSIVAQGNSIELRQPPIEIQKGWEYRWENSLETPNLTPESSNNLQWRSLTGANLLLASSNHEILWLRVPLPEKNWQFPSLYFPKIPKGTEVYLKNSLIHRAFDLHRSNNPNIPENSWPIVPLPENFSDSLLYLKITQNASRLFLSYFPENILLGSQPDLTKAFIKKDIDRISLGFLFAICGVFPLIIALLKKTGKIYISFGLLFLTIGIYTISTVDILVLTFGDPKIWKYIEHISFYFLPVGIGLFFEEIFGKGYASIVRRVWQLHLIYAISALIITSIRPETVDAMINGARVFGVFSALLLIAIASQKYFSCPLEGKLFTAGFSVFLVFAIHDILLHLGYNLLFKKEIYYWGMFLCLIFLAVILERRFRENRNQLKSYAFQLETKNKELERLDQIKDEFLANTSHELRTPLNGIIGISESLIDGIAGRLSKEAIANLSMIVYSGKRLTQLVNDLLDFSQLKHKEIQLQTKPLGMHEIADVVLLLSKPLISGKLVKLNNSIPPNTPLVEADENRVQQILHNLVSNAVKFTKEGSVDVSSEVMNNQFLAISVKDSGIGIEANQLDRIFQAFEQGDGSISREYGGTGLGLAVTKQLVELHGGKIWVESSVGVGSKFTFTLPLSQVKEQQHPLTKLNDSDLVNAKELTTPPIMSNEELTLPSVIAPTEKTFHILIVDDEVVNRQVLVNHLSLNNYSVTQAADGIEALKLLESGLKPDLVLLDLMMPKMTGYEVCQAIRKQYSPAELPIVLLTAKSQVSDIVEAFDCGANDYLTKPISKNELLVRIKTHIRLAKINIAYGRFVPHEFLRFLEKESIVELELGDQILKEMTVLFSDIRSFTTLSETMTPKENFDFLNSYLSQVGPVIRNHNGFIDKYIGDAVMALFPQSPEEAIQAAIAMQQKVELYNRERMGTGYPFLDIGVGIHTGNLMLGTIGEEQRMESTVIADAVNLASRLEGLTKVYGADIVVSEETLLTLTNPQSFCTRFLGRVQVKGKRQLVGVVEVYDTDSELVKEGKNATKTEFEQAVSLYHNEAFAEAQRLFEEIWQQNQQDQAASLYIERCQQMILSNRSSHAYNFSEV
ncbi:MAG: ATP-binding protein [Halothece sp.]